MAMGTRRKRQHQQDLFYTAELAEAPGHPFYTKLNAALEDAGLLRGKTIGVDATTLEANAAMRSIVRRATGEQYREYLKKLAAADGEPTDAASVQRQDRKRKKKVSNKDWVNPHDPEAEITKLNDGRTRLAYKAEQAVDLETGAIVAMTTHSGATGDTTSIRQTVPEAGEAVAEQIAKTQTVHPEGVAEVVADKGYHSAATLEPLAEWGLRSYVSEPKRGRRKWRGKIAQQAATFANRRRVTGARGKQLLRSRGEKLERPFAHQYETGGMRRLWVRGLDEVHKKLLLQAAACNLALLLRTKYGAGTPRGLAEARKAICALILALLELPIRLEAPLSNRISYRSIFDPDRFSDARRSRSFRRHPKMGGFDTGCQA